MGVNNRNLVVGISGASGSILGIRLLEVLRSMEVRTHLIISSAAQETIRNETDFKIEQINSLADVSYKSDDVGAQIASGSFPTIGMVIIPCSIKTLSAVANSYSADLISRAADVTLKEGRKLVLVVRESPLHAGHLRLMTQAASAGAVIFPPVPAFYSRPNNISEVVDNIVGRVLMRLSIENELYFEYRSNSV